MTLEQHKKEMKLYKEISDLLLIIPNNQLELSPDERQDIISNTLITILRKESEGKLQLDKYEDYKGYMYIVTKSYWKKHLKAKYFKKKVINQSYIEDEKINNENLDFIFVEDNSKEEKEEQLSVLNYIIENILTEYEKDFIKTYLKNRFFIKAVQEGNPIPTNTIQSQKKRLFEKIKFYVKQYEKYGHWNFYTRKQKETIEFQPISEHTKRLEKGKFVEEIWDNIDMYKEKSPALKLNKDKLSAINKPEDEQTILEKVVINLLGKNYCMRDIAKILDFHERTIIRLIAALCSFNK